jgi:hypothetical protein
VNRKVSKYSVDAETPGRARALIGGFTDTNEYEFTLTAYSYAGNASTPVTVKGTPEDRSRAKDYLVETVTFDPQVEAVNINWTNELNADVNLVLISLDYFNIKGKVDEIVREVEATTPHVEVIDNLPIETDIEVKYYMVDNETGEKSETKTATFQVLPTIYDIYDAAVTYIPESYYGINMMTIDWNETKNEFHILTSGNDPYVYTKMPSRRHDADIPLPLDEEYHQLRDIPQRPRARRPQRSDISGTGRLQRSAPHQRILENGCMGSQRRPEKQI